MKKLLLLIFFLAFGLLSSVSAKPVGEVVTSIMFDEYGLSHDSYEIEILSHRLPVDDVIPERVHIKPITQKDPLGLFTIIVQVDDASGEVAYASQMRMRIKKYEDVLVVNSRCSRHEVLSEDQVTVERREITDLRERAYKSFEELKGLQVKSIIQKDAILTERMFNRIPDITSGSETTIIYADAGFKITAEGVALQTGSSGDYIKVKNKTSNKIIVARIVDQNFVTVDP